MRGTNFCTDALLGAIYAELGLMAVTAETTPGGEKASSALPEAAACADRTPCSSASACTPVLTRLGYAATSGHLNHAERPVAPRCGHRYVEFVHIKPRPLGHFGTVPGLNLVCLNDAVVHRRR